MATGWEDAELSAAVDVYFQMLRWESDGTPYVKTDLYRQLAKKFPRTSKSFEFRMQNISHVFLLLGRQWLAGLKPASNVGANVTARLLKFIKPALLTDEGLAPKLSQGALTAALNTIAKEGPVPWPFSPGIEPEDLDWTDEVDAVWTAALHGHPDNTAPSPPKGVESPEMIQTVTQTFVRDKAVIDWVLRRANGVCECCRTTAPFIDKDSVPFLEVHHLRRLADGGSDRPSNAVGVCPNCHRRLHFGVDRDEQVKNIYGRVDGLTRE